MATLPPSSDFTGSAVTEGGFKTAITALRAFLAGLLGADGTLITALKTLLTPFNATLTKSGAYTVVAADQGKVIRCSNTWTLALSDAAALGDGFNVTVVNTGSGTITIDPYLTQQIDGATTYDLAAAQSAILTCDGSSWRILGKGGVTSFNTRFGAVTLTGADITGAGGALSANVVAKDNGVAAGSFAIGSQVGSAFTAGNTYSGAAIGLGTGTWRAMQSAGITISDGSEVPVITYYAVFQRIS